MTAWVVALERRFEQQQFPAVDPLRLRTLCLHDQLDAMQQLLDKLAKEREIKDIYMQGVGRGNSERERKRALRDQRNG